MKVYINGIEHNSKREIAQTFQMGLASITYEIERKRRELNLDEPTDEMIQEVVDRLWKKRNCHES